MEPDRNLKDLAPEGARGLAAREKEQAAARDAEKAVAPAAVEARVKATPAARPKDQVADAANQHPHEKGAQSCQAEIEQAPRAPVR